MLGLAAKYISPVLDVRDLRVADVSEEFGYVSHVVPKVLGSHWERQCVIVRATSLRPTAA
jgi:hypothetical protein